MKLYARLENKYNHNDHVIGEFVKYYTEQEVLNEYWTFWVKRTKALITKENCLTDWLKVYQGWVDMTDDDDATDDTDAQAYDAAKDEILAMQYKILDEILDKKELKYNNDVNYTIKKITLKELYNNLAISLFDIVQERVIEPGERYYFDVLASIAHGDVQEIRKAFVNGDSAILIPDILECIEEIRIYDNDTLLMVIVGDEIQY